MPFLTEEIYCTMNEEADTIMTASWPVFRSDWCFPEEADGIELIKEAIRGIRNVRTSLNVPPSKKASVYVVSENAAVLDTFRKSEAFFATLAHADHVILQADKTGVGEDAVSAVIPGAAVYIPFAELVDVEKEKARLENEKVRLGKEIARCSGMLNNEKFISKAPAAKVEEEKAKLEKYTQMLQQGEAHLAQMQRG